MDERAALALVGDLVSAAGDDAAVVGDTVLTIDMLHAATDFPDGVDPYTMGWRAVGASLSDVAAMGAAATATVAVYGAPEFDADALTAFVEGAIDVSELVGAAYVGGDLDEHAEPTVATTAIGTTDDPVYRDGASPGEAVCVTGDLGRTAAALRHFEAGDAERGNELFRFEPRVPAGRALAEHATAMMDSSDGLARSLHQLGAASEVGFAIEGDAVPVSPALAEVAGVAAFQEAIGVGEDFELVCTLPPEAVETVGELVETPVSVIGEVVDPGAGIRLDGELLPDEGWTHGRD